MNKICPTIMRSVYRNIFVSLLFLSPVGVIFPTYAEEGSSNGEFPIGDPISSIEIDGQKRITEVERDGVKILRITETKRANEIVNVAQEIVLGETKVAVIVEHHGRVAYMVRPNVPVSVTISHSDKGHLEGASLISDTHGVLEIFEVADGKLVPIGGDELQRSQRFHSDLSGLLDPERIKNMTREEFLGEALGTALKYRSMEEQNKPDAGNGEHPPGGERSP